MQPKRELSTCREWKTSSSVTRAWDSFFSSFCESQKNTINLKDTRGHVCVWAAGAHESLSPRTLELSLTQHNCLCSDSPLSNWSFLYFCIISVATMHSICKRRRSGRFNKQVTVNIYGQKLQKATVQSRRKVLLQNLVKRARLAFFLSIKPWISSRQQLKCQSVVSVHTQPHSGLDELI